MYGISGKDIESIDKKIDFQKKWLENFSIDFSNKSVSMLNNTYSANLNPKKYFAEINNRVNTMVANAKEQGLKPIFITITAPSAFHRKYDNGDLQVNPNDTAKEITQIWNKFTNLQVFQKMKKELDISLTYFRVYEPHKSGVPHLHALLFLPSSYILKVKKKFYEYFTNKEKWGSNIGGIGFRYTWYKEKGGAVGYVMKYILKTFKDTDSKAVQHSAYWYIKHSVRRFLSSRTLAPLTMYRKVRYYFKNRFGNDLKDISRLIANGDIYKSFEDTVISYRYFDNDTGEVEEIVLWSKNADLILHSRTIQNDTIKLTYVKKEQREIKKQDFTNFANYKPNETNSWDAMAIVPSRMKDYQLQSYYKKLDSQDINTLNLQHFNLTRNEMIKRGLITGTIQSLNTENGIEVLYYENDEHLNTLKAETESKSYITTKVEF